ncbi:hypothetical protein, partial [Peribacillus loiseleuriae]|uniref:hypothetical protein n=1 Tax=Peribacillus loiseleuriae TaxID=1679170 RepID=UPI003D038BB4
MKKTILFLIFTLCFTNLIGCTKENGSGKLSKEQQQYEYTGETLKIAIVGNEKKLARFKNVSFHLRKLEELVNGEEPFDALIVTKEGFKEADKEEYVAFFNEVKYPVFFYGINGISDSAFLEKNRTIEQARINSETYIKGYVNTE